MFKTVTSSSYDEIFRNINDAAAKELKLLKREAEKLDWSLMLDTDLGEFGLLSHDGLIGQYPYMQPDGYRADTASISSVRNLVSLFAEKIQPVSNQLEWSQREADELRDDLGKANEQIERLNAELEQARISLRGSYAECRGLEDQLRTAQAELAELKGTSDGGAAATETGETA